MQISPVSYNPNFNGVERLRLKDGSTLVINAINSKNGTLMKLSCNVWYKGKNLKQLEYSWPKGLRMEHFDSAARKICDALNLPKTEENVDEVSGTVFSAHWEKGDRYVGDGE